MLNIYQKVSIPSRYDPNLQLQLGRFVNHQFQSLQGTIQTKTAREDGGFGNGVSIPSRYDPNTTPKFRPGF